MKGRYVDILEFSCGGEFPDGLARVRVDQVMDRKVAFQIFMLIAEAKAAEQKAEEQAAAPAAEPAAAPKPEAVPRPLVGRESHRMVPAKVRYHRSPSVKSRDVLRRTLRQQPNRADVLKGRQINDLTVKALRQCLQELGVDWAKTEGA